MDYQNRDLAYLARSVELDYAFDSTCKSFYDLCLLCT